MDTVPSSSGDAASNFTPINIHVLQPVSLSVIILFFPDVRPGIGIKETQDVLFSPNEIYIILTHQKQGTNMSSVLLGALSSTFSRVFQGVIDAP